MHKSFCQPPASDKATPMLDTVHVRSLGEIFVAVAMGEENSPYTLTPAEQARWQHDFAEGVAPAIEAIRARQQWL